MINTENTFCTTTRRSEICRTCERHLKHKVNKIFDRREMKTEEWTVKKVYNVEICRGYRNYPIKESNYV